MKNATVILFLFANLLLHASQLSGQNHPATDIERNFLNPPESARPWVFWYWMHAAVSKEGITADLEAMKKVGIGGAYLMSIKDTSSAIPFQPVVRQLTPEWWQMVKFAMQEAKRLNLKLAMHVSDGFALAGGPWITPELSMQKLVWTKTYIKEGSPAGIKLSKPVAKENYYKDIAVLAYPAKSANAFLEEKLIPLVTTSNGAKADFLAVAGEKGSFRSDTNCWIQYQYAKPFTCRSIQIHVGGNNYQAQRLIIQSSDDGFNFKTITRLEPPRHGWQDTDEDYTYALPAVTAAWFRFVYNKEGTEPGAEDLDAAKWKPSFKINGIYLSDEPVIHQYEAKNGSVWRVVANTTRQQVNTEEAVPLKGIIDLTNRLDNEGNLNWTAPTGNWVILRIGHTSTGHTNYTGGAGLGLECDKFNVAAVKMQFDNWFAKTFEKTDPVLAKEVLKIFHVDSWECGSQNWSTIFPVEFKKRRGYDLMPYLLVMAGVPVQDAATSEKVLHDVRQTIAELLNDIFYSTLNKLAHEKGCRFSAESVAPTMVSDGLLHYKNVDLPMGEFWLNSPTHDKPNDMLDAISGAHIYGKNIIQAEAFTSVRMNWGEHPGNLKALGDRNFALGINKMVLHVFTHNPWMDKKPGMTLDGVGLYFQKDQTWFKQSKAWIDYLTRCQALLQMGKPVVDIAVFIGEEIPRRSVLPDRLVNTLPGIFGKEKIEEEKKRLANVGQPLRQIPDGVSHSANMADPENWIDPLNGYTYDSFNPDVLMMMKVVNGRVITQGGASYGVLVIPGKHPMNPNGTISAPVINKLKQLANAGAKIIVDRDYFNFFGNSKNIASAPYTGKDFESLGLKRDMLYDTSQRATIEWSEKGWAPNLAVCRRDIGSKTIYFVSNQNDHEQWYDFSVRYKGLKPEIYNPVTGRIYKPFSADTSNGFVKFFELFAPHESKFFVFEKAGLPEPYEWDNMKMSRIVKRVQPLYMNGWEISFKENKNVITRKLVFDSARLAKGYVKEVLDAVELKSWTEDSLPFIKYFSGTAVYRTTYTFDKNPDTVNAVELQMQFVMNIASVKVNGIECGTVWTQPYHVDIKKAIKPGENKIEIEVTNTWHNRLIGDNLLPQDKRTTWTTAPFRLKDKPLLPAGITGRVEIFTKWGE